MGSGPFCEQQFLFGWAYSTSDSEIGVKVRLPGGVRRGTDAGVVTGNHS